MIGVEDKNSTNLTSNAARFATRTGLDDRANGEGRGTQVNAVRQALWQAAISSQFDSEIANRAGNAYLTDMEIREGKTDYYSRFLADQAVDQRNNRIGRSIGSGKPGADMKALLQSVLFYYHKVGLWTASEVKASGRKVWRISQEKLSEAEYRRALKNIAPLNTNGMVPNEQNLKTDTFKEIKKNGQSDYQSRRLIRINILSTASVISQNGVNCRKPIFRRPCLQRGRLKTFLLPI